MLSRIVPLRRKLSAENAGKPALQAVDPLKLVIMSATLRTGETASSLQEIAKKGCSKSEYGRAACKHVDLL